MRFVILSPRQSVGGAIVLHALCKFLCEHGQKAKIFYSEVFVWKKGLKTYIKNLAKWLNYTIRDIIKVILSKFIKDPKTPRYYYIKNPSVKGCKRKYFPFVSKKTIVIYPEVVAGNPLRAKNVVRWFLYYYHYKNERWAYKLDDLFVTYRDEFNDADLNPHGYKVQTPYFNLDLYKRSNYGIRSGKCYIIRKGKNRNDLPKEFDGIVVDDLLETDKVRVFNQTEYCISYDTQTAYSDIASICGCKSIIVPELGKQVEDYRYGEDTRLGVAIGFSREEEEFAEQTRGDLIKQYSNINEGSKASVESFIRLCSTYFSDSKNGTRRGN